MAEKDINADMLLSDFDVIAIASDPAKEIVRLQCDGEYVGSMVNGRWLHRLCRNYWCKDGCDDVGEKRRDYQRFHVYDIVTGDIVRTYDRPKPVKG